ncbi:short-chain type dehydrogenase/reductase-like [Phalaenopsis equestris]|uniref:short-chain type dehydrogenase/reductase-like n=1 Tax=Phalaenopsis equestris TaxID=78828 RepID=UPI0009E40DD7|nr:short-chain type dehydrogenase/reductase-like [Phalaenopsis equestris]
MSPPPIAFSHLNGKVAIVTGASEAMGRATALCLASHGAFISLVFSSESSSLEADGLATEINSSSSSSSSASIPRAITIRADISDPDAVRAIFDLTEQNFKSRAHIVFHSAGIIDPNYYSVSSTPLAVFDSINPRKSFLMLQEAANRVVVSGEGRIILLHSWLVENQLDNWLYAASMNSIQAMIKALASELQEKRIRVNCISTGPEKTGCIGFFVAYLSSAVGQWINGQILQP